MYLVSPQLLVTREHIISDNASTSCSLSSCERGESATLGLEFHSELDIPFGRIPFLFDLCEYAFCLVIDAMGAFGHLAIAFDLFLATHIASLYKPRHQFDALKPGHYR